MIIPAQTHAVHDVRNRLAELLGLPIDAMRLHPEFHLPQGDVVDAIVKAGPHTFVIEWRATGATGPVAMAAEQVRRYAHAFGGEAIPLVAVPYMGEVGRRRCNEAGVSWLDLSGNAGIAAPGLRVLIEGKPNRFKRSGRPTSVFASRSSRIARRLLMHPNMPVTQRQLAQATGLDQGYTSRIVARLRAEGFILVEDGGIRPRDPAVLLDAWREEYDFTKHHLIRGHVPARSGDELLRRMADALRERHVKYAATALGAAWFLTRFATFRLTTLYLREPPPSSLLEEMSFREDRRGANLWLVVPKDEGVFHGAAEYSGIVCVHPVQVYVDLKNHPERSKEAADQVRSQIVEGWRVEGGR